MGQHVAYHFHGYQPGDIVRRLPSSPMEPMAWEARRSPVEAFVGEQRLAGENWTDCMLRCYDTFLAAFEGLAGKLGGRVCSVDIEPFTLEMLLAKDQRDGTDVHGRIQRAVERGVILPVVTTPFHPFLPYLHPFEQEVLAALAFDFYGPWLRAQRDGGRVATGVWLSEGGYTREAASAFARAYWEAVPPETHDLYLLIDARQFVQPQGGYPQWSLNYVDLGVGKPVYVFGRDVEVSDAYSFGSRTVGEIVDTIVYERADAAKDEEGVAYLLTMASDLEALVGSPAQLARFRELMVTLHDVESWPTTHADYIRGKVEGRLRSWEGEGRDEAFSAAIKEYSSWSDYSDQMVEGRTGDTRWQGMRRVDGLVISRIHKGRRVSQVWKQGVLAVEAQVEGAVRRAVEAVVKAVAPQGTREGAKAFLVAYGRLIFQDHYRHGFPAGECTFAAAVDRLGPVGDPEALALAARAYYEMLMGLRSDPCFWENLDTRVTFQNIVMLTHALVDMMEACGRVGETVRRKRLLRTLQSHLLGFESVFHLYRLGSLSGLRGWETTEEAWLQALQSEVPAFSSYNVVQRAALFALEGEMPKELEGMVDYDPSQVVAATGHIVGEGHGHWAQRGYCEHREKRKEPS